MEPTVILIKLTKNITLKNWPITSSNRTETIEKITIFNFTANLHHHRLRIALKMRRTHYLLIQSLTRPNIAS